jgi:hypothetical protein
VVAVRVHVRRVRRPAQPRVVGRAGRPAVGPPARVRSTTVLAGAAVLWGLVMVRQVHAWAAVPLLAAAWPAVGRRRPRRARQPRARTSA